MSATDVASLLDMARYEAHHFTRSRNLVRNVDDAIACAYLAVAAALSRGYGGDARFGGYVRQSIRHALVDWRRAEDLLTVTERRRTESEQPIRKPVALEYASCIADPAPSPEEALTVNAAHRALKKLLATKLTKQERRCIDALYWRELTLAQHAKKVGCSESRVCQIRMGALAKLRAASQSLS